MTRTLLSLTIALGLITSAHQAHAITLCTIACAATNEPCSLPCNQGTQQHPSVTTCGAYGSQCTRLMVIDGAPAPLALLQPGATCDAPQPLALRALVTGWLHGAARWLDAVA